MNKIISAALGIALAAMEKGFEDRALQGARRVSILGLMDQPASKPRGTLPENNPVWKSALAAPSSRASTGCSRSSTSSSSPAFARSFAAEKP